MANNGFNCVDHVSHMSGDARHALFSVVNMASKSESLGFTSSSLNDLYISGLGSANSGSSRP